MTKPIERLAAGEARLRHIILISGKDSLATALVQRRREPSLRYEYVFNEVGWELPETFVWLNQVEAYLGEKLYHCGDDLDAIVDEENCLPLPQRRFCTRRAKIKPLRDYLGKDKATIYFGLRSDETDRAGYVVSDDDPHQPAYPLREAGLTLPDVWRLCESVNLLPPAFHWPWMEQAVRRMLCGDDSLLDSLEPWHKAALLAWRTRNNCSLCFFKRLYEWIGLHEFHPSIFAYACRTEAKYAHRDEHGWLRPGKRLPGLIPRADIIKRRRAKAIVKFLKTKQVRYLFDDGEDGEPDLLSVTSCGLFCGK